MRGVFAHLVLVSVTLGILFSYWIDYGTNYIGGTRCAPDISYSGGTIPKPAFDPYHDVPVGGCTGQSEASWRFPLALQILPAVILGVGMLFFPDSPRWLLMKERDDESITALSKLRRQPRDSSVLLNEYLEIKASIMLENSFARENFPNLSGYRLHMAQVCALVIFWGLAKDLLVHVVPDDMGTVQTTSYWLCRDVLPAVHGL